MLQISFSLCTVSKIMYFFLSVLPALSRLVASSYTEDTYGVVQKVIKSPFVFFPIQWMPFVVVYNLQTWLFYFVGFVMESNSVQ